MPPTETQLWREVLGKLHELHDEVQRVEDLVHGELGGEPADAEPHVVAPAAPSPFLAAPAPHWGPAGAEPPVTVSTAARLVARIRRELEADPLHALALAYPAGLFAPETPPEQMQREGLRVHAMNTARLAMYVAAHHGFEPSTVDLIGLCALLHDVGMTRTPPELFAKAAPLTSAERFLLEAHTIEGADLLDASPELGGLLRTVLSGVVRQHHERIDGSGYPDGAAAPHIHEFARLLALAEAYETMVTPRPYRRPCLPNEAMETLLLEAYGKAGRAVRFDRRLAASFVRALSLYPIGSGVCLATGEMGQVVGANADDPARPYVRILWGPDGQPLGRPRVIDLSEAALSVARPLALPVAAKKTPA